MFRHQVIIFRELLEQKCTSHIANLCFVHCYKLITLLVVKMCKVYEMCKVDIVNILQCFESTLIIFRLSDSQRSVSKF